MADNITKLAHAQKNGLLTEEFWAKRLLEIIAIQKKEMVFQTLGETWNLPKNQGTTTMTVRRYLPLPVDTTKALLAEGKAPDAMQMQGIKVSGKVKQYGALIKVTDVTDTVHLDDLLKVYQPEMARHAVELTERVIIESFAEASEHFVGGHTDKASLTPADTISYNVLREVGLTMRVNKRRGHKKVGGSYIAVLAPNIMQDLLDDPKLRDNMLVTGNTNTPIKNGSLESFKVYNFFVQESLMLEGEAEGDFNVYPSIILGDKGYQYIELDAIKWKSVGFEADSNDPLGQTASYGYKGFFGAKVTDPMTVHRVWSRSSEDFDILPSKDDKPSQPAPQTFV